MNVPIYVGQIAEGKFREALATVKATMPFAAVCGRVCHHPCESKCLRGQFDEPLAVHSLKRFAADYVTAREGPQGDAAGPERAHRGDRRRQARPG